MKSLKEKYEFLQKQKNQLEVLKSSQLYIDTGIFVLNGEMIRSDGLHQEDSKVYIHLETLKFVYVPVCQIEGFEEGNVIFKRDVFSFRDEWKEIRDLSDWFREELEYHKTEDAIRNFLRMQYRRKFLQREMKKDHY